MSQRVLSIAVAGLLVAAPSWAVEAARGDAEDPERPELHAPAGPADPALQRNLDPAGPGGKAAHFREHAPLALFSLGSLAVGGVFYGIHRSFDRSGGSALSGDGTRVDMAIGAAGLSALAAGAAYCWYAFRPDRGGNPGWTETVAAGLTPEGAVAAKVTLPLSSLID